MPRKVHTWGYATKLPSDYVRRTLAGLLPPARVIQSLDHEGLAKLALERDRLRGLIEANPAHFFTPASEAQRLALTTWDTPPYKRVLLMLGANKIGKTTCGAMLVGERLLGRSLWGGRTIPQTTVPARAAIFAEDLESHSETILPTLITWLPRGSLSTLQRNSQGHPAIAVLANGSVIHFKSYEQGSDVAEGKDWDIVWFDEPPPRSVYTAAFRGVVSRNGRLLVTATLLKEVWLYDEISQPFVQAVEADIYSNPWIDRSAVRDFLATLSPEERLVRESGKPASLVGLIYKNFRDGPPFVIPDPPELPRDYPYILAVDPHERKPVHAIYGYITPNDVIVWCRWLLPTGGAAQVITQLREFEAQQLPAPPIVCVLDPNRGKAVQKDGCSWAEEFEDRGYTVILGQDKLDIGHARMYEYLDPERPRMQWTEACRGRGGPIEHMLRYTWDEWVGRTRDRRDPKEKPRERYKDWPDCHRYVAMENFTFDQLTYGPAIIECQLTGYGQLPQQRIKHASAAVR